jgi:hypothetical protein
MKQLTIKKLVNPANIRSALSIGFIGQLRMELFQSDFQTFTPPPDQCKPSLELECG